VLLDIAARIGLMPVLIGQAFSVRRHVLKLPEPDGLRLGKIGAGAPLRLLILGDSSAAGVGVETQDAALLGCVTRGLATHFSVSYELIAKTGARTQDARRWLDDKSDTRYDVVVTALGVNDVTKATTAKRFAREQAALLDRLHTHHQAKLIVASAVPPMDQFPVLPHPLRWVLGRQAARLDAVLDGLLVHRPACHKVVFNAALGPDVMAADGFHPGARAYAAWADLIVAQVLANRSLLDPAQSGP
jgi:lysophospholipase L1-like esterase